ncbi:YbaK/aminoacyl-tRNA synthetase associated region [Legionella busanensis]|uniref:YbaK/aminoacyl-tRNA synthetase associated region n=1 Tax=Legionella busanensis TaxID=190655 RepID=A0A378JSA9_9GAMM|nr:YbaK/EbsC family protein [Legionella busanensis]STX51052.1 YbaK/aminoacyl-tRNA synthetase associated region [Legionella busanensis]
MNLKLTKSAQSVQDVLTNQGLPCRVIELSESTRTAAEAARTIGCSVAQIIKSLIFKTKITERPVLVLASGANQVNEKIINAYIGEKIIRAEPEFVRDKTGFAIGGIPPIGHKQPIDFIFIDEDLLNFEELWAAAGTPNAVFSLTSKNLVDLTKGIILAIK